VIERVQIENFKGIKQLEIVFPKVSIFVGPNGSGKSTVLQALSLLKQTSVANDQNLRLNGPQISLGDWKDIVHLGDAGQEMKFSLTAKLPGRTGIPFVCTIIAKEGLTMVFRASSKWRDENLDASWKLPVGAQRVELPVGPNLRVAYGANAQLSRPFAFMGSSGSADRQTADVQQEFGDHLNTTNEAAAALFRRIFVVGSPRGVTQPANELMDGPSDDIMSGEARTTSAVRLLSTVGYSRKLEDILSQMTKRLFGVTIAHQLVPNKQTSLRASHGDFDTNVVDEGSGLNQLLIPLAQLALAPSGSFVAVEEPEIHLHPKKQGEVTQSLVERALLENKQLVITTHSEHVVLAAINMVLSGKMNKQDFALYQFHLVDGAVKVRSTEITDKGTLDPGLEDFFDVSASELAETLRALGGGDR